MVVDTAEASTLHLYLSESDRNRVCCFKVKDWDNLIGQVHVDLT